MQADNLDSVARPEAPREIPDDIDWHAELVRLEAGRDVRMAASVDVGIHPQRDTRARAPLPGESIDAIQLPFRFRIDRLDAEIDRLRQFTWRFADTGKDNL